MFLFLLQLWNGIPFFKKWQITLHLKEYHKLYIWDMHKLSCLISWPCFLTRYYYYSVSLFWLQPWSMEVPGQGLNLSCSCDQCHSCSNGKSLTCCATVGTPDISNILKWKAYKKVVAIDTLKMSKHFQHWVIWCQAFGNSCFLSL